jgi:hypothetical protein
MPYTITIEPAFLRIVLAGAVTSHDLQAIAQAVLAIEASQAVIPNRLADFSAMTEPFLTYPGVRAFVDRRPVQPLAYVVKSALVAPRPIHLGFARMFQLLNKHPQIQMEIFATLAAAETWLRAE